LTTSTFLIGASNASLTLLPSNDLFFFFELPFFVVSFFPSLPLPCWSWSWSWSGSWSLTSPCWSWSWSSFDFSACVSCSILEIY
jgi:hypothetical protein